MVLGGDNSTGLLGGLDDQLLVQRLPGEHIDHADGNAFRLKGLISLQGLVHHDAGGDDGGHVLVALVEHNALADGELGTVLIDLDDALADKAGIGHAGGDAG